MYKRLLTAMENKIFEKALLTVLILITIITSSLLVEDSYGADVNDEILDLVNLERETHGLNKLNLDQDLIKAANIRVEESVQSVSHTRPDGSPFYTVSNKVEGENLAAGVDTPQEVMKAWMDSPDHRENILNPKFTTIGIAYKEADTKYKNYWIELFGGIKKQTVTLKKVTGIKVSSKAKKVTLSWKAQSKSYSTGYVVHVDDIQTKKYKLHKKIVGNKKSSLTIKGLKKSKTYRVLITSYKVVKNKSYYTPSSTIRIKVV